MKRRKYSKENKSKLQIKFHSNKYLTLPAINQIKGFALRWCSPSKGTSSQLIKPFLVIPQLNVHNNDLMESGHSGQFTGGALNFRFYIIAISKCSSWCWSFMTANVWLASYSLPPHTVRAYSPWVQYAVRTALERSTRVHYEAQKQQLLPAPECVLYLGEKNFCKRIRLSQDFHLELRKIHFTGLKSIDNIGKF